MFQISFLIYHGATLLFVGDASAICDVGQGLGWMAEVIIAGEILGDVDNPRPLLTKIAHCLPPGQRKKVSWRAAQTKIYHRDSAKSKKNWDLVSESLLRKGDQN